MKGHNFKIFSIIISHKSTKRFQRGQGKIKKRKIVGKCKISIKTIKDASIVGLLAR